jgi:hypothetical protein
MTGGAVRTSFSDFSGMNSWAGEVFVAQQMLHFLVRGSSNDVLVLHI